jgi:hypothetical protein
MTTKKTQETQLALQRIAEKTERMQRLAAEVLELHAECCLDRDVYNVPFTLELSDLIKEPPEEDWDDSSWQHSGCEF